MLQAEGQRLTNLVDLGTRIEIIGALGHFEG